MNTKLNKLYALIVSLLLVFSGYELVFLKNISISYLLLLLILIIFFLKSLKYKINLNFISILLVAFLIILSLICIFFTTTKNLFTTSFVINSIKILVWALLLAVSNNFLKKDYIFKYALNVSIIGTLYLIFQSIMFYIFSIKIPNGISFGIFRYVAVDTSLFVGYRPASFFPEPSYYATYVLVVLCMLLFWGEGVKNRKILIILLGIGIILSTSTGGIYLLLILYFIYYISNNKKNNKKFIMISIILLPIITYIFVDYQNILPYFGRLGYSLLNSLNKISHHETSSRLGGSYQYLNYLSGFHKYFGYSIGNEYTLLNGNEVYLNSLTRLILQSGYIGLIIFVFYIISIAKESKSYEGKYILIMYIVKCLTGGAMFSVSGIYMLTILYMINNTDNKNVEGV